MVNFIHRYCKFYNIYIFIIIHKEINQRIKDNSKIYFEVYSAFLIYFIFLCLFISYILNAAA